MGGIRTTFDDVKRVAGDKLVSGPDEFKNAQSKLRFLCEDCNAEFTKPFTDYNSKNKKKCPSCGRGRAGSKKWEDIEKKASEYGVKLISKPRPGVLKSTEHIHFYCGCGDAIKKNVARFFEDGGHHCYNCGKKKGGATKTLHYDTVKKFIESKGVQLISKEYEGSGALLKLMGQCGHKYELSYHNLKKFKRYSCPQCGRQATGDSKRLPYEEVVKRFNGRKVFTTKEEWETPGVKKIRVACDKCGKSTAKRADKPLKVDELLCQKCAIAAKSSRHEKEIANFVQSLGFEVERNNRRIFDGKEIDVWIPSKKLGIELNGLYWHSESKVGKILHREKADLADELGITLLQFWDFEWDDKREIVQNIIKSKLGVFDRKIYARKCSVVDVSPADARNFCEESHLQGYANASIKLGLEFQGEIVSLLTAGDARYNKADGKEIIRFCNAPGTVVVGGFSKLLKNVPSKTIVSFADRRISTGNVYTSNGFKLVESGAPCYWYFDKNKDSIYHRSKFMKHKLPTLLEEFDPIMTEVENMSANGYERVFDAGQLKFTLHRD